MTPQEQQLLMALAQRVNQAQLQEKDPDAENLLGRELGANPDAVYILAQTVLVQNIALDQAKAQVTQLQQQLQQQIQQARQQPAHSTSFLGRLLGEKEPAPSTPPPPSPSYQQAQQGYQPVPTQYSQPQHPPAQYAPPYQTASPIAPGQPSFLRGAMQTAAGVAAGALAFEGVESLIHGIGGLGHPSMGMAGFGMAPGFGMGGGFERPVEETVVNNYYDSPGSGAEHHEFGGDQQFRDTSDRIGDQGGARFSDASYSASGEDFSNRDRSFDTGNDQNVYDPSLDNASVANDTGLDDMQIDDSGDSGSFDDAGSFDDSGGDLS